MNLDDSDTPGSADIQLKRKGSKAPLRIVAVLVLGAGGFFVWKTLQKQEERKLHAKVMEQFASVEKDDVGKFWVCVLGPNIDAGMFPDNLAFSARVTSQFGVAPKTYPTKMREECTPKAVDAAHRVQDLKAPSEYDEGLKKYAASLKELASTFDAWSKVAPQQVAEMEMGKKLDSSGAAWHAFEGGKPTPEVINFDRFLHCAVPTVDTMKDGQALVELLFNSCKKPEYVQKLNEQCGKELVADPPGLPTKSWQAAIKKLGADDRDLQAFDDCLRKGRKGKRRDDLAEVGKAWVAWLGAGREVRTIGKEALKE